MKVFLLILLVLVLLLLAAGYILFLYGVVRSPRKKDNALNKFVLPYADEVLAGIAWFQAQPQERVSVISRDGLKLSGWLLPHENARGTILLVHGYRSDHRSDFAVAYQYLHSLGFNILAVDQRAHGESEGKYITFGVKERFDIRDWTVYLCDRFGPEHPVILEGISMGCSTVLMALGTELPPNVRGVIADCGFTSPYDQFCHMFRTRYHFPIHPLMDIAGWYAKLFAGFGLREYSTLTALRSSELPVLFFHGESDTFVPPRFSQQNFDACRGYKALISVPGAGHGGAYMADRGRCQMAILAFLGRLAPQQQK